METENFAHFIRVTHYVIVNGALTQNCLQAWGAQEVCQNDGMWDAEVLYMFSFGRQGTTAGLSKAD